MNKKRENAILGWTPFKSRWNSSMFLFKCKNCDHEYLKEISPFTIKDITLKSSDNYKKFWAQRFQCPKCKNYIPLVILILEPNNTDWSKSLKQIEINNEKWGNVSKDSKMLILDDYKGLLPNSKPNKEIIDLFKKHNSNVEIKYIEYKPKVIKSIKKLLNKKSK